MPPKQITVYRSKWKETFGKPTEEMAVNRSRSHGLMPDRV